MTKYVKVKIRKEKARIRTLNLQNLEFFKACCDFFDLTLQDFYILLHNKCNVDTYYTGYDSFKYGWHQYREAMAQKEGIQKSVDSLKDVMISNMIKAFGSPKLLGFLKGKWRSKIDEITCREDY